MVGVVLVTHPNLGEEFIRSAELICGKFPNLSPVSIDTRKGVEELRRRDCRGDQERGFGKRGADPYGYVRGNPLEHEPGFSAVRVGWKWLPVSIFPC